MVALLVDGEVGWTYPLPTTASNGETSQKLGDVTSPLCPWAWFQSKTKTFSLWPRMKFSYCYMKLPWTNLEAYMNKPSPFLQHMILAQMAVWWLWRWHDKRAEITQSVGVVTRVLSLILVCCSGELNCSFQGRSLTSLYNFSSPPSSQVLILHSLEMATPLLLPLSVTPRQSFVILIFHRYLSLSGDFEIVFCPIPDGTLVILSKY